MLRGFKYNKLPHWISTQLLSIKTSEFNSSLLFKNKMNPILLKFANGTTFFVGLIIVIISEGLLFWYKNRITRPILTVLAIVGIILAIISATPLPIWAYTIWTVLAITCLILLNRLNPPQRLCKFGWSVLVAVTISLYFTEAPYQRSPHVIVPKGGTVYVLGDSISAGMGTKLCCWPEVLNNITQLRVINLAQPGATIESAITQAKKIVEQNSLVIIEIGGNDLLGGTDTFVFRAQLDNLVSLLCASQHEILMIELPLFPFQNAYGKAQRDICRKYDIAMLPKRFFAKVLGTKNGTIDGLHLSQAGHDTMALIIANVITRNKEVE